MKILLYGKGNIFKRLQEHIPFHEVTAIVDKRAEKKEMFCGVPVILPAEIVNFSFEYIAVLSDVYFEEIYANLICIYGIPEEKIIHWSALRLPGTEHRGRELWRFPLTYGHKTILGWPEMDSFLFTKWKAAYGTAIDRVGSLKYPVYRNIYRAVYEKIENCPEEYDLADAGRWREEIRLNLSQICKRAKNVCIYQEKDIYQTEEEEDPGELLSRYGQVTTKKIGGDTVWYLRVRPCEPKDITVYVVVHKEFRVINGGMYCPLCVGGYTGEGYLRESGERNISYLNEKINECTALYWIWKNTQGDYVGLNHYRRYFCENEYVGIGNILTRELASELLEAYDIIAGRACDLNITVFQELIDDIQEAAGEGYALMKDVIGKRQPDYLEAYEDVMKGHHFYLCNMFITKREILNQYCEWLFSFLIEAAERFDIERFAVGDKRRRTIGFFAERMLTVWLMKQELRITELPMLLIK